MVNESKQQMKKISINKTYALVVAVLSLVVLSGVIYMISTGKTGQSGQEAEPDSEFMSPEEKFDKIDADRRAKANQRLETASDSAEKARAYIELANAYSASDSQKALEYAKNAAEEYPNVENYSAVGHFADLAGDKESLDYANQKIVELGGYNEEW